MLAMRGDSGVVRARQTGVHRERPTIVTLYLNHAQQLDALSRELNHLRAALHATTDDDKWCQVYTRFDALLRAYVRLIERTPVC
jgi:hypothetical protein